MWLFSIALLPCAFIFFQTGVFSCNFSKVKRQDIIPIVSIFLLAVFYVAFDTLFIFSNNVLRFNFFRNFLRFFLFESFIPLVACAGLLFLFSKENFKTSFLRLWPIFFAFYSVFLPYRIFSRNIELNTFVLFIKPILYCVMIIFLQTCIRFLLSNYKIFPVKNNWVNIVVLIFVKDFICIIFPAIIETIYIMNLGTILWVGLFAFYVVLAVLSVIYSKKVFSENSNF